jgi:hypothetical protein
VNIFQEGVGNMAENDKKINIKDIGKKFVDGGKAAVEKVQNIDIVELLQKAAKLPGVAINREEFLKKELDNYCTDEVIALAIKKNPAFADISRETINKIADEVIKSETTKVTSVSAAAGLPGGFAMAATMPADLVQYFGFLLRVMQKLAYLYGFERFDLSEEEISPETNSDFIIFLGVMFGVKGANAAVKKVGIVLAHKISKSVTTKAIEKGVLYPVVRKIAQQIGLKLAKQTLTKGLAKTVPILGAGVNGFLTYSSFKPCALRLQKSFKELPLSDPDFYKEKREFEADIVDADYNIDYFDIDVEEIEDGSEDDN